MKNIRTFLVTAAVLTAFSAFNSDAGCKSGRCGRRAPVRSVQNTIIAGVKAVASQASNMVHYAGQGLNNLLNQLAAQGKDKVVVFVYKSNGKCQPCELTLNAIKQIAAQHSDVTFVCVPGSKYPNLHTINTFPELRFYENGTELPGTKTGSQSYLELRLVLRMQMNFVSF